MESFLECSPETDFPLENLPYGVFSKEIDAKPRPGVALGNCVVDLAELTRRGFFAGPQLCNNDCLTHVSHADWLKTASEGRMQETLNAFMGCGVEVWAEVRSTLKRLLSRQEGTLRDDADLQKAILTPMSDAIMHLPATIGDFTDFNACKTHAVTVGTMFRGADHALNPNWLQLPVAYHGRSSSIVLSGTDIPHPLGQWAAPDEKQAVYAPSVKVDYELEMGVFVGPGNEMGSPISVDDAWKHVFGCVLLNDWSLRDVQFWEGQPLGPFTSKNFATTISPWVVPMEALEPFKCDLPPQEPPTLPYLTPKTPPYSYDVQLQVELETTDSQPITLATSNLMHTYWSVHQMLAHHTSSGCNLRPGDLIGTGTLSAEGATHRGCLLEASKNGTEPFTASSPDGSCHITRSYLEDGDCVVLKGWCEKDGIKRFGFGPCSGRLIRPNA